MTELIGTYSYEDAETIELGGLPVYPPGDYLARVVDVERDTENPENVFVRFQLKAPLQLVDGAPIPEHLGQWSKMFPYQGPIPAGADARDKKKRRACLGMFKGLYKAVTGSDKLTALTGAVREELKSKDLIIGIGWVERLQGDDGRAKRGKGYTYSQWVATGKPEPSDTFFQDVKRIRALKPEDTEKLNAGSSPDAG